MVIVVWKMTGFSFLFLGWRIKVAHRRAKIRQEENLSSRRSRPAYWFAGNAALNSKWCKPVK